MLSKSHLEKSAKRFDVCAKYLSLPCLVVSLVCTLAATVAGNQQLAILNLFMTVFNACAYWINITFRNHCLSALDKLDEIERLDKIKSLNPNKR